MQCAIHPYATNRLDFWFGICVMVVVVTTSEVHLLKADTIRQLSHGSMDEAEY